MAILRGLSFDFFPSPPPPFTNTLQTVDVDIWLEKNSALANLVARYRYRYNYAIPWS
jgi:hypothetical protein